MANRPTLSELRAQLDAALKETLFADLRAAGFKGSFPDFRRVLPERTDVLHIQFDKYGGRFRIVIASARRGEYRDVAGNIIQATKLRVSDVPFDERLSLRPPFTFFRWFPFVFSRERVSQCTTQVQAQLPKAMAWWANQ